MNGIHYTSPSRSSQAEAVGRANKVKASLNLAKHPLFEKDYGEINGRPMDYYAYKYRGIEVALRYNQEWKAICPRFNIEMSFPHQPPHDISILLDEWLAEYVERHPSPATRLRQRLPAVQELAEQYNIDPSLADEIMRGR
jgi:hypothetical protein